MAGRFDRIAEIAQDYFGRRMGYDFFGARVDKAPDSTGHDLYIGIVSCKCGYTPIEVFYNPFEKSARIMTYHQKPTIEEGFAGLLENMGIQATVEVVGQPTHSGAAAVLHDMMPHSPSGRVGAEEFDAMIEYIKGA